MEEAFLALLAGSSTVTAHVAAGRINWGAHPQGAGGPYIVLTVISEVPGLTLTGADGLAAFRVQADVYAATHTAAKQAARAVITRLHGYSEPRLFDRAVAIDENGEHGGAPINENDRLSPPVSAGFIRLIEHAGSRDSREGGTNEADRLFRVGLDFLTHWRQT